MSSLFTREKKYQQIKYFALMDMGLSLHEVNRLRRIVHTASMRQYMSEGDFNDLNAIADKLDRFAGLLETRKQKKKRVMKKYSRGGKGEDRIANMFALGGIDPATLSRPVSFVREEILKRKKTKRRAPTRAGSSAGKIGKTTVIGAKRLNIQIDKLADSLNQMIRSFENLGDKKKAVKMKRDALNNFIGSIRTSVTIKGKR